MNFFTLVGLTAWFYFLIYIICLWFSDCNFELIFSEKFGKGLTKLKRKVVWITQVSTELGRMMALKVAQNHGKLVLSSVSMKELKKLKSDCLKVNPYLKSRDILVLEFEITDLDSHKSCLGKVIKHFGMLDILIINDDKWEKENWETTSPTSERFLFHSNVFGVLSLSRLAVKYFNVREEGKLAVTSSIAGLIGVPYSGAYAGTKHALHGYFNSLKIEKLGENIQTTLLCLGSSKKISQDKFTSSNEVSEDERSNKFAKRRKISAERYAQLCLTAIVNNLDEAWMAVFPILPLVYGLKYYPNITKTALKYLKSREEQI